MTELHERSDGQYQKLRPPAPSSSDPLIERELQLGQLMEINGRIADKEKLLKQREELETPEKDVADIVDLESLEPTVYITDARTLLSRLITQASEELGRKISTIDEIVKRAPTLNECIEQTTPEYPRTSSKRKLFLDSEHKRYVDLDYDVENVVSGRLWWKKESERATFTIATEFETYTFAYEIPKSTKELERPIKDNLLHILEQAATFDCFTPDQEVEFVEGVALFLGVPDVTRRYFERKAERISKETLTEARSYVEGIQKEFESLWGQMREKVAKIDTSMEPQQMAALYERELQAAKAHIQQTWSDLLNRLGAYELEEKQKLEGDRTAYQREAEKKLAQAERKFEKREQDLAKKAEDLDAKIAKLDARLEKRREKIEKGADEVYSFLEELFPNYNAEYARNGVDHSTRKRYADLMIDDVSKCEFLTIEQAQRLLREVRDACFNRGKLDSGDLELAYRGFRGTLDFLSRKDYKPDRVIEMLHARNEFEGRKKPPVKDFLESVLPTFIYQAKKYEKWTPGE